MGVGCEAPGPARLCYPGIELQPCSVFLRAEVRSTWTESVSCAWIRTRCVDLCCEDLVKEKETDSFTPVCVSLCSSTSLRAHQPPPLSPLRPPSWLQSSGSPAACWCCWFSPPSGARSTAAVWTVAPGGPKTAQVSSLTACLHLRGSVEGQRSEQCDPAFLVFVFPSVCQYLLYT